MNYVKSLKINILLLFLLTPGALWAHAVLLENSDVPPRYSNTGLKEQNEPCGYTIPSNITLVPTNKRASFPRGATVKVEWKETVPHAGHFLVDVSSDNEVSFQNEVQVTHSSVAYDNYSLNVTLPENCLDDHCVVRMRQYMEGSTKPYYFSCADVDTFAADATQPDAATMASATAGESDVQLTWSNPANMTGVKGVLLLRDTVDSFSSPLLADLTVYHFGDQLGSASVIGKIESGAESFADTQFSADTDYYYAVYVYSDSYYYSLANSAMVHTLVNSGGTGGGTGGGNTPPPGDSGGGAMHPGYSLLLLLLFAWPRRKSLRYAVCRSIRRNR